MLWNISHTCIEIMAKVLLFVLWEIFKSLNDKYHWIAYLVHYRMYEMYQKYKACNEHWLILGLTTDWTNVNFTCSLSFYSNDHLLSKHIEMFAVIIVCIIYKALIQYVRTALISMVTLVLLRVTAPTFEMTLNYNKESFLNMRLWQCNLLGMLVITAIA